MAVEVIIAMYQLIHHASIIAIEYQFQFYTIYFQKWRRVSVLISKLHCWVSQWYHLFLYLPVEEYTTTCMQLAKMYDYLPSPDFVKSELHMHCWQSKWHRQLQENGNASLPTTISSTLRQGYSKVSQHPCTNYYRALYRSLGCSAERSFSGLARIKTPLRSSMTTERLTGLTLLQIRDIPVDISAATDEFARHHPRRLVLQYLGRLRYH